MGPQQPQPQPQPQRRRRTAAAAAGPSFLLLRLLPMLLLRAASAARATTAAFAPPIPTTTTNGRAAITAAAAAPARATSVRMMAAAAGGKASNRPPANLLAQIRRHSQVIVDTADYEQIEGLPLVDEATTNPSIVWAAAQQEKYFHLLEEACNMYRPTLGKDGVPDMLEAVPVKFARELYRRLPPKTRKVYFQLDPRHSFDADLAIDKARFQAKLATQYHGIPPDRLVLKIPGSWEGIQATRVLEQEGINCLVTAVTSVVQAAAAADAGASYIAPYVGRVTDWKGPEGEGEDGEMGVERGVRLARDCQFLYRAKGCGTKVMAASIRGPEQARALAGCDVQTMSPALLVRLECADPIDEEDGGVPSFLPSDPGAIDLTKDLSPKAQALLRVASPDGGPIGEAGFRAALAADACGTQVFAQGMKLFLTDLRSLEKIFLDYLAYAEQASR